MKSWIKCPETSEFVEDLKINNSGCSTSTKRSHPGDRAPECISGGGKFLEHYYFLDPQIDLFASVRASFSMSFLKNDHLHFTRCSCDLAENFWSIFRHFSDPKIDLFASVRLTFSVSNLTKNKKIRKFSSDFEETFMTLKSQLSLANIRKI